MIAKCGFRPSSELSSRQRLEDGLRTPARERVREISTPNRSQNAGVFRAIARATSNTMRAWSFVVAAE
jgi:hypothetical protein